MKVTFFLLCFAAVTLAVDQEVCYDGLGCFSTAPPFSSFGRIALLPEPPEEIDIKFFLYTRNNSDVPEEIKFNDELGLRNSKYDGRKPTKFLAHGWMDKPELGIWMQGMVQKFLISEDCNAFIVDWQGGGRKFYAQAAANTRVVGALIAQMIEWLGEKTGTNPNQMHILGHSLGGQVAGYAGERIPNLARITGMDPAGPYFENTSAPVRLDETDANFVDVLHTDAADIFNILIPPFDGIEGLGTYQPSGHVDVYVNGGKTQPGCKLNSTERIPLPTICNHLRAFVHFLSNLISV